ncbi:MAG TPA: dihydrofolate reductase [Flavobacteriales bacterium]|nr:dihydrofolate reductase [Flavobacteriales bacterium]HQV76068.1 dihydrofolate reductase [Flavobacteriales bacterium]HQW41715.1 dihydrofolate reductase [Flavobacteriales bacterium]
MIVSAIVAMARNRVIGRDSDLPWRLPDDMKFFQRTTIGHHVITGRKNYETIPPKYRPLKDRVNIVVTRNSNYAAPGAMVVHSLKAALELARTAGETEVFIIGGGQIYKEALEKELVDRIYLTEVEADVEGDTTFPALDSRQWKEVSNELHPADERHEFAFRFVVLVEKS